MFKKITALLCLTLSIVLFCMAVSATDAESTDINAIYVSGTAVESGTGVVSAPVTTLSEAFALLGDSGTIYLMDTVEVSATEGDCFIAPAHTGKITITSADGYIGTLDLTAVAHFHFGGETELSNIGIVANDLVLTADNHTVTMGAGLAMSSSTDGVEYRGGHAYCDARIHLAAYAPCETANKAIEAAGGELYVHSGEYWSVSTWYGETVTANGGETLLYFGKRTENEEIWVRYLCPGLYGDFAAELAATDATVTVITDEGLNTPEIYRFTKGIFSGNATVNWILKTMPQGEATVLLAKGFSPEEDAVYTLHTYTTPENPATQAANLFLMRGAKDGYTGEHTGDKSVADYCAEKETHSLRTRSNGQIICSVCNFEQCRHRSATTTLLADANCTSPAYYQWQCTDICNEIIYYYDGEVDTNNHSEHVHKYVGDPVAQTVETVCSGCNAVLAIESVQNQDVLVSTAIDFSDAMLKAAKVAATYGQATLQVNKNIAVPASYSTPIFEGTVTITGKQLWFKEAPRRFYMNGDVTFENITFRTNSTSAGMVICAQNNKLVMGEGIVMGNVNTIATEDGFPACNCVKMYVVGGFEGAHDNVMNTDITIRSGDYWYIGGWNYLSSTSNGTGKITIGKTNPDDKLQVFYLCPFSHGDGFITTQAESTIIVDGDLHVKRFYLTTLNDATMGIDYVTNVVLQGDITGYNAEQSTLPFDLRGCPTPYPQTVVNVYTDNRVETATEDSYVFFGHPDGTYRSDFALGRLKATLNRYTYINYCKNKLGGHVDSDSNSACDECGYVIAQ